MLILFCNFKITFVILNFDNRAESERRNSVFALGSSIVCLEFIIKLVNLLFHKL